MAHIYLWHEAAYPKLCKDQLSPTASSGLRDACHEDTALCSCIVRPDRMVPAHLPSAIQARALLTVTPSRCPPEIPQQGLSIQKDEASPIVSNEKQIMGMDVTVWHCTTGITTNSGSREFNKYASMWFDVLLFLCNREEVYLKKDTLHNSLQLLLQLIYCIPSKCPIPTGWHSVSAVYKKPENSFKRDLLPHSF